ncbi:hypothetical protein ACQKFM_20375 [Paenibacillus xylanexedens]|uniref:hypothetical protein n=1 Tax=Paenibacillus xylanexedens TaxID=528191 RepID=UPI003D08E00B
MDKASEDDVDGRQKAFFSTQYVLKRMLFLLYMESQEAKLMQELGKWVMYTKVL